MHQAPENSIYRLSLEEAYPLLLQQTYRPKDPVRLSKTLELVHYLAELPVFSLECTISAQAVKMAHRALTQYFIRYRCELGEIYESKKRAALT